MWVKVLTALIIEVGQRVIAALFEQWKKWRKREQTDEELEDITENEDREEAARDLNNRINH